MIKLYKEWVESKRLANIQTRLDIVKELNRLPYLSKRFILTEYFLTTEQLERNDALWKEENGTAEDLIVEATSNLFNKVGITKE